jgi:hypothetical protein
VSRKAKTVFSVGVISIVEDDGSIPAKTALEKAGAQFSPSGKTNIGLGRGY